MSSDARRATRPPYCMKRIGYESCLRREDHPGDCYRYPWVFYGDYEYVTGQPWEDDDRYPRITDGTTTRADCPAILASSPMRPDAQKES